MRWGSAESSSLAGMGQRSARQGSGGVDGGPAPGRRRVAVGARMLPSAPARRLVTLVWVDEGLTVTGLARRLRVNRRTLQRLFERDQISWVLADRIAVGCGYHPCQIWPQWFPSPPDRIGPAVDGRGRGGPPGPSLGEHGGRVGRQHGGGTDRPADAGSGGGRQLSAVPWSGGGRTGELRAVPAGQPGLTRPGGPGGDRRQG